MSADESTDERAVATYLEEVPSPDRRRDAETLVELFARATGERPRMWGRSIIGFGEYHYRYASGREGDAPAASFSPRKAATTIYLGDGADRYTDELARLGAHTTGVACLYVRDVTAVDLAVLERIVGGSYRAVTTGTYLNRATESEGGQPQ
jgi:hypothetical protein